MTFKPQLRPVCGRCGRRREGIRHVCRSNSSRKATVKLKASFGTCGTCGKDVKNPLTHVCKQRSDYKRRKAAFARRAEAARRAKERQKRQAASHDYQACSDRECRRPLCVAFKTGWKLGHEEGYEQGYTAGYAVGFVDGIAACPLPHGG